MDKSKAEASRAVDVLAGREIYLDRLDKIGNDLLSHVTYASTSYYSPDGARLSNAELKLNTLNQILRELLLVMRDRELSNYE